MEGVQHAVRVLEDPAVHARRLEHARQEAVDLVDRLVDVRELEDPGDLLEERVLPLAQVLVGQELVRREPDHLLLQVQVVLARDRVREPDGPDLLDVLQEVDVLLLQLDDPEVEVVRNHVVAQQVDVVLLVHLRRLAVGRLLVRVLAKERKDMYRGNK